MTRREDPSPSSPGRSETRQREGPPAPTNLGAVADAVRAAHEHVRMGDVNDHRMILAVNERPYRWHEHPDSDELFVVLEGSLTLEFEGGSSIELGELDTVVIPAGTVHRTVPSGRCVNLVLERAETTTLWVQAPPA